jgi:RNA polymerase sigma factor (sigma-70 family)
MEFNQLINEAQNGNLESRNKIIEEHLDIINKIVNNLCKSKFDESTKRYGALMGIMKAIQKFDPKKGNFKNYAYRCAYEMAKRELSKDLLISFPINKLTEVLKSDTKSPYVLFQIDKHSEYGDYDFSYKENFVHLDNRHDFLAFDQLKKAINYLSMLEKDAITNVTQHNLLKEIAERNNVTPQWVRVTRDKALKKIKKLIKE